MDKTEKPKAKPPKGDHSPPNEGGSNKIAENKGSEGKIEADAVKQVVQEEKPVSTSDNPVSPGNGTGSKQANSPYSVNIKRVLDINLPVTVSFGSTKRSLSEVLKLAPGALLELDKAAEDPVVLKVNDKVFAWGKVVDVDGYYGVEITDIMTQADRIVSLGEV